MGLDTHSFDEDRAMRVQVCRWQSVAPEHRQQAVDLLRQAFPDMQGEGYAIPGPVALVLAMGGDHVVAHLALYERNVLLDGEPERMGLIGGVVVRADVRRQGIASRLIEAAHAELRRHGIDFAVLFALDHRHYASAGYVPMQNETCFIEDGHVRRFVYRGGMVATLGARRWTTALLDLQGETV
ncbi:TPA: GNAT family N-acetyltransferase [Stenotrophomonas maltophilia]|uniref:GNAT family N-acetyltransferase n=1 Tax=Stenotrophomonas maltophilia TaxID=40324 RepID=UPI002553B549|nr:GNAT family N-acetyltransferase [Stenotrophomonas maltophilia]MDZ5790206.1 GNAT family N-acetyltransferase [Stenotrophomonas maltophilia]HEL3735313.1 GNAT family N-acetyltransferase [Stenotrophomonas maltophilia]HEL4191705.1 GNAT family N-acetyltransferase [Stenotrophomonas maltophilia]HEL4213379.1 GNAT family N-acetyltransferase [Stenotrophomonas maltophilia]HEL4270305.1 GNAT family N-acetyltransferase [Stenotrophomonas maltophilia]